MTRPVWTVLDCERSTDHESALYTLTLEHKPYTAYVSIRPHAGVPAYDVLRERKRRGPSLVWPREAGQPAIDPRSALYAPLSELRHVWTAQVCSLTVHAYLGIHSPYCPDDCGVPELTPAVHVGVLR